MWPAPKCGGPRIQFLPLEIAPGTWNVTSLMKKKPELVRATNRYGQAKWSLGLSLSIGHEAILTNHK